MIADGLELELLTIEAAANDEGHLYAFRVNRKNGDRVRPGHPFNEANDYLDLQPGDKLAGRFAPEVRLAPASKDWARPANGMDTRSASTVPARALRRMGILRGCSPP